MALVALASPGIRRAVASDQRYIASTWWHSALGRNRAPRIRRRLNAQIDQVLDDPTTRALVTIDAQNRIIGWLVYATTPIGRVVHYAYVREGERSRGVAGRLMSAAWPSSEQRVVLTMKGPSTAGYLDRHTTALFVPLEEFLQ
jgi:hypothetical protein